MISAVILAAGKSERMGQMKQLLRFGGSTILATTIDRYTNSVVDEVIVVLGHDAETVRPVISGRPLKVVVNTDYRQGISTSIITGLKNIDNHAGAVLIALGDQPLIDIGTINLLIAEFSNHEKGIAVPIYRERRGHPVIFSIKYKNELLSLIGDTGARDVIRRHLSDVLEVPVNNEAVCLDIDTPESYQSALSRLEKNPES